jgi:hypothetical protein
VAISRVSVLNFEEQSYLLTAALVESQTEMVVERSDRVGI